MCLGAIAIAAPLSAFWEIPDDIFAPIQQAGDVILLAGLNRFPPVQTAASTRAATEILAASDPDHPGGGLLLAVKWAIRLHSMEYYLRPDGMRQQIGDAMIRIRDNCNVQISQPPLTLVTGTAAQLQPALTNLSGQPLPSVPFAVISTAPDVWRVYNHPFYIAGIPGTAVGTVYARGRAEDFNVTVATTPPPPDPPPSGYVPPTITVTSLGSNQATGPYFDSAFSLYDSRERGIMSVLYRTRATPSFRPGLTSAWPVAELGDMEDRKSQSIAISRWCPSVI